jgi:hypothetical protein
MQISVKTALARSVIGAAVALCLVGTPKETQACRGVIATLANDCSLDDLYDQTHSGTFRPAPAGPR